MRRAAVLLLLAGCGSETSTPRPVILDANPLAPMSDPVTNLAVLDTAPATGGDVAPPCPDATWLAAKGGHAYLIASCRRGRHVDVTVYQDGKAIGRLGYDADAASAPDVKEAANALCIGGVVPDGATQKPWSGCFHLNLNE